MLKVGDKVKINDWSYVFGVKNGKYNTRYQPATGELFTVIQINLTVTENVNQRMSNGQLAIADLLITDDEEGYWFVTSYLTEHVAHTVAFDGGSTIEISDELFEALKREFNR